MIGRLRGVLCERELDGTLVVDVQGVGYEVTVPKRLSPSEGEELSLFIHTHVREDSFSLYGFDTREDRQAFLLLLSVATIGPRLAMAILSALPAVELAGAVAREETSVFKGIPGVGKRTVERLMVELREKLPTLVGTNQGQSQVRRVASVAPTGVRQSVVQALTKMGYRSAEAENAVGAVLSRGDKEEILLEDLLRSALGQLAS